MLDCRVKHDNDERVMLDCRVKHDNDGLGMREGNDVSLEGFGWPWIIKT